MHLIACPPARDAVDPDLPLVRAMARGDERALETLYERHGSGVWAFVLARVGDRAVAEEILQDVMLAAWRGAAGFRGASKVRTWLLTIAHHRAVNALRRRGGGQVIRSTSMGDDRGSPQSDADDPAGLVSGTPFLAASDDRLDLRTAVDGLAPDHRTALDLVFFHDLTVAEAAEVLGVAPGTVKSRLHRARAALRAVILDVPAPGRAVDPVTNVDGVLPHAARPAAPSLLRSEVSDGHM
jgi:RNA polymerase sigma factor (sigma-70 family)